MDFLLWVCRSLHLFSVIVWLGGTLYQAVILLPARAGDESGLTDDDLARVRSFAPFVWTSIWTVLVTGIAMMLFDPRFVFFQYADRWSVLLGLKQLTFIGMAIFAFGYFRMAAGVNAATKGGLSARRTFIARMHQFSRINVALAIVAVLLASAMRYR